MNFYEQLIVSNSVRFRLGDSCINQLIFITHNIFHSFDSYESLKVRRVFLDISKAFNKVWYDGLIYKLKKKRYFWRYFTIINFTIILLLF